MTRECFWGECIGRQALRGTYIGCEHGIAGRRLVHGHRETEGAGPQAPMLQQWDPLGRGWRLGLRPGLGTRRAQGEEGRGRLTVKPTGVSRAVPGRGWQLMW